MASFVSYKFRSQTSDSRIQFEGSGISVFDLRRQIQLANNLNKTNDFDLVLYDQDGSVYHDDNAIIPRSSYVIVRRLPATRSGRGRAARYQVGEPPSRPATATSPIPVSDSSRPRPGMLQGREPASPSITPSTPLSISEDEASRISAMLSASQHYWKEAQEKMSQSSPIRSALKRGASARKASFSHAQGTQQVDTPRPTPAGYVCYRCGQKGHWIKNCPTNGDPEFDNRPRLKRTTGIPRTFLKPVNQPILGPVETGVMITPHGDYAVAQPDAVSWRKQITKKRKLTEAEVRANPPSDESLVCLLCSCLFREAVKTPCCGGVYCEECIQTHLLDHDFECPACHSRIPTLDQLMLERSVNEQVQAHIDNALAEGRAADPSDERCSGATPGESSQGEPGNGHDTPQPTVEWQPMLPDPAQIQADIDQVHTMLRSPALAEEARLQLRMRLLELTGQVVRARRVASLADATLLGASSSYGIYPRMHMGAMGMMAQSAWEPSVQWTNPFANQPPPGRESAYERLPVNDRRSRFKRDRPADFLEVCGEGPANKAARYWE